ncbi:RDD family protein [Halobacillus faecis]
MKIKQPAGFWVRLGARALDGIILGVVFSILTYLIYGEFFRDYTPLDTLNMLYFVLIPVIWYGYTIGKKATGVRIIRKNGEKVGVGRMLLREFVGSLIYALTLGIGIIVSAFMVGLRDDKRAIHDFIAGTYVTHQSPENSSQQVMEGKHA